MGGFSWWQAAIAQMRLTATVIARKYTTELNYQLADGNVVMKRDECVQSYSCTPCVSAAPVQRRCQFTAGRERLLCGSRSCNRKDRFCPTGSWYESYVVTGGTAPSLATSSPYYEFQTIPRRANTFELGLGVQYKVSASWSFRSDWQRVNMSDYRMGYLDTLDVEAIFKF